MVYFDWLYFENLKKTTAEPAEVMENLLGSVHLFGQIFDQTKSFRWRSGRWESGFSHCRGARWVRWSFSSRRKLIKYVNRANSICGLCGRFFSSPPFAL